MTASHQEAAAAAAANSRLRETSKGLPRLNLEAKASASEDNGGTNIGIQDMIREMKNPLSKDGGVFTGLIDGPDALGSSMPPPLSAIITPRVSNHEGNSHPVPKYFPTPLVSSPPAPITPMKSPPSRVSTLSEFPFDWISLSNTCLVLTSILKAEEAWNTN